MSAMTHKPGSDTSLSVGVKASAQLARAEAIAGPGTPALAAFVAQLKRRAADAEAMQATAPVAAVLRAVIGDLQALNGASAPDPAPAGERSDHLLTAPEVAARLGTSVKLVYRSASAGRWPFTRRVGRLVRFSAVGLDKWLARR